MPAAVAVPAIISVAGMAAGAIGQHKAKKAAQQAAQQKQSALQNVMDFNYNADLDYYNKNQGNFADIFSQASAPQTTSSSSTNWQDTVTDATQSMDFGAEGNAAAADVLKAARNAPFEVNALLAEQEAAANRAISGAQRTQRGQIGNLAAARGVDARLMSLGMDQPFNAQRLDTSLGTKQQAYSNKVGAQANIANVLKGLFQKDVTHSEQRSKGGQRGTSTGPANFGAMLGALQAGAPPKKEFADVPGGQY